MNRKWIALLLSCALVLTLAAACGRKDTANNSATTPNNNASDGMNNNMNNGTSNGSNNTNTPGNMTPGNELNNGVNNNGTVDNNQLNGNHSSLPNTLMTGAEVAATDLFDTLGVAVTDLETAMRDVTNMGENGNYTYRHNLLGQESDVSYGYDEQRNINKVTVKAPAASADEWRNELTGTLGAQAVDGQMDTWTYNQNQVKIADQGDHVLITIEKHA